MKIFKNKYIFLIIILLILIGGYLMFRQNTNRADVDVINATPSVLSKMHISKGKLEGLDISNAHIKGMIMEDVEAEWAEIKNITFENCTFTRVFMLNSLFENVAFKNCIIQNKGNPEELHNNTIFAKSVMKNVLFENTKLHNVDMTAIKGRQGYVFFRNMRDVYPPGGKGSIIQGGMHIRIVDSDIDLAHFVSSNGDGNASFYAKNSKLKNPFIRSDLIYMQGCDVTKGTLIAYKSMVLKDSIFRRATIVPHKIAYLVNNTYENAENNPTDQWGRPVQRLYRNSRLYGEPDSHTYVIQKGQQRELAHLNLQEGNITVKDVKFFDLGLYPKNKHPMHELNLRNVEILNWSDWQKREIISGKWENVKIHGPVHVKDTKIENVQAYNLTFPKGEPWQKEGEFVFDVTKSPKPFEWEEIKVPTPEDLGLEWWPMEPGYHPEK